MAPAGAGIAPATRTDVGGRWRHQPRRCIRRHSAAAAAVTATGAPLRTGVIYFPNGAIPASWWPTGAGQTYELNKTMDPLEKLKYKFQVIGGLQDLSGNGGADGGGDHARATSTFLTGVRIKKTGGKDYYAGTSFDQIIAKNVGYVTPYNSLELSCDTIRNAGACDTGYACIYQHNLAWSSPTSPMTPEVNPRQLFERLFGTGGTAQERMQSLILRQQQQRLRPRLRRRRNQEHREATGQQR